MDAGPSEGETVDGIIPMSLRRAKALAKILAEMNIYIRPSELIVGNYASTLDSVCFYPEFAWKWVIRDTAEGGVYEPLLDNEGREELKEICEYWRETGLSIHHRHRDYIFEDLAEAFWIFNSLENLVDLKYKKNIKKVSSLWKNYEAEEFAMQPAIEQAALLLLKKDKNTGRRFLTLYSSSLALEAVEKAKKMVNELRTEIYGP